MSNDYQRYQDGKISFEEYTEITRKEGEKFMRLHGHRLRVTRAYIGDEAYKNPDFTGKHQPGCVLDMERGEPCTCTQNAP